MELSSSSSVTAYKQGYSWKAAALFFVITADLIMNAFADHYHNPQHGIWYPATLVGVQFLVQLIVFLLIFMMFLSTYLFQVGLLDTLWSEFRLVTLTLPAYFVVFVAYLVVKLILVFGDRMDHRRLWEDGLFIAVALTQKVAATAYYAVIIATTLKFGEMRWYLKDPWVRQYQHSQRSGPQGQLGV